MHESVGFGLGTAPFADTDDDAFFFPSDQHLRALEFMGHSLWTKARLGVVTAEHGCGKSLLIRRLLNDLDERIVAAASSASTSPARDFLLEILRQFGFTLEETDKTDRRRLPGALPGAPGEHRAAVPADRREPAEHALLRCWKSCAASPPSKWTACAC